MVTRWKQIAAIAVGLAVLILGFRWWLKNHDASLLQAERTRVRLEQLQADNQRLNDEVAALKLENQRIQVETERKVAEIVAERRKADTPAEQVTYIAANSPLHPSLQAPNLVFPDSDAPILADILSEHAQLQVKLTGCEQQKGNLESMVADREKQLANKDEEIALVKRSKNATTRQKAGWFLKGLGIGAGIALWLL